jgi:hypothetical protein
MQSALALGVATLGSLFLSLDTANSLGMRTAFVVVIGVQAVMALLVAVAVRGLPQPGRVQTEPVSEAMLEAEFVEAA